MTFIFEAHLSLLLKYSSTHNSENHFTLTLFHLQILHEISCTGMYSIKSIKPPWRKQYVKLTKVSIINGEILCGINEMLFWISSSKLLFLFNLAHYERLFKDLQAQVHGEPVTGLLMIYPHHMIHVVEVRGLNGLILARLWDGPASDCCLWYGLPKNGWQDYLWKIKSV